MFPDFRPVLREGKIITVGAMHIKPHEEPKRPYKESLKEALERKEKEVIENLKKALTLYSNPNTTHEALIYAGELIATYSKIAENLLNIEKKHRIETRYSQELRELFKKVIKLNNQ